MSRCHEAYRRCASVALVLALVLIALPSFAQTAPKASSASSENAVPKVELFVGYQWLNPGGVIPDQSTPPKPFKLPSIAQGFGTNLSYNFTEHLALEGNYGGDWNSHASISAATIGPKFTWRSEGVNFFAHTLIGFERLSSRGLNSSNGIAAVLGGGMDVKIWKPLSLRLFEADYQWAHENFANNVPLYEGHLRHPTYEGVRLTTGLVFNFGGAPELPVAAACSVDHPEVMVGESVHATVAASNFNPKHTLTYTWASNGGKVDGKDTGATIDTNGVSGGSYTVTATVTDPKAKKNNTASCTANFTVKEPPKNPPQISCSASPSTVQPGSPATITCTCTSPDNVPVTVGGWTSSGGSISGNGNSATLDTTGASPGSISINATCTDSRGLTASTSSAVTVETPPVPPPQASKLNECLYPNEKKPWRVDNTCKAALDDVALKLQQDSDAKLVVVGNADPKEKRKNLAAERALNVKAYISGGEAKQNIDPSRIETRTGSAGTANSEHWIVPAGATFPEAGATTPVDETKVKAVPDHPKPAAKPVARKKAVKKAE
jgi:outer membrane protein OmpA-like peptidoglycan-associated protein